MATAKAEKKPWLRPLAGKVIVRPDEPPAKTPGGLEIPEAYREKHCRGVVTAVGLGKPFVKDNRPLAEPFFDPDLAAGVRYEILREPVEVQVGDHVTFPYFGGQELEFEGEKIRILKHEDILTVIEDES
jgi:chaperonin GroES